MLEGNLDGEPHAASEPSRTRRAAVATSKDERQLSPEARKAQRKLRKAAARQQKKVRHNPTQQLRSQTASESIWHLPLHDTAMTDFVRIPQRAGEGARRKVCEGCARAECEVLIRCGCKQWSGWRLVCGKCWTAASGGVPDGDLDHRDYRYGGLWRYRGTAGLETVSAADAASAICSA